MIKKEPFRNLFEHYMSRYTAGCFCVGDTIEFNKKIFSDECFKKLQPDLQQKVKDMAEAQIAGDAIIMVANVSIEPLSADNAHPSTITIAYSLGGGRYYDAVTIPGCLLAHMKRIENGVNLPDTVPASKKINYDEKFSKTAQELDLKKGEKLRTQGHVTSTLI
jgi:hypothetical protein